ncbi:IS110 family transposase [Candidatus Poribacteria bacterium]|nr:IS110 family transposase [Candidatus Poribacteria bacterium]
MWSLGIDWAEKHLDYCLLSPSGDVLLRSRVENTEAGFAKMLSDVTHLDITPKQMMAAIESPHQPVVDFLMVREVIVYPVNPTAIYDYRKSLKTSGSKSDAADAELIASYVRLHHQKLRAWRLAEPELRQLQILVADRDKLVSEKVRLQNQLRETLLGYFPQAVQAFSDLSSKTALDFLSQFPTPSHIQTMTDEKWQTFLNEHRVFHPKARQRFCDAMKQPALTVDDAVVSAKALFTETVVIQLKALGAALESYQKQIEGLFKRFDDSDRFLSLPGVDVVLGAKLLVAIGTDRERFTTADELGAFFGTSPYTKSSGQHKSVHFRKACHKKMRSALHQMALASLRSSTWAKAYFAKKRKEGKKGAHALRCLANLWLKVIFALWKTETVYQEDKHLASVARHQLAQPM